MNIGVRFVRHALKARGTFVMKLSCDMFRRRLTIFAGKLIGKNLMNSKQESAPGPDGIPYDLYRCAGGLGSRFLHNAYKHVLEGGVIPALFAESRTVFIPKSFEVDKQWTDREIAGRTTSVDAVFLRMQDSYHGNLPRASSVHYEISSSSQRCISEMYLFLAND